MKILRRVVHFFDKIEDSVRIALSHYPLIYSLLGGIGVVLFYRGIWMIADDLYFMTGPVSAILGIIILMLFGLLISTFVGDSIIISGLKKESTKIERIRRNVEGKNGIRKKKTKR